MCINSEILVSICTLTYNQAHLLRDYFERIFAQNTIFKYEIIINDDCSTDGTQDILREYSAKYPDIVKPFYQTVNLYSKGEHGFFPRFCFPRCSGKYVAFCEGDDIWSDPNKLQKQVDYLESHPECVLTHCDMDIKNITTGTVIHNKWKVQKNYNQIKRTWDKDLLALILQGRYSITTLTVCARMSTVREVYSEIPQLIDNRLFMDDTPLWMALSRKGKVHFFQESMAVYNVMEESVTHSRNFSNIITFYSSCLYMVNLFSDIFKLKEAEKNYAVQEYIHFLLQEVYIDKMDYYNELRDRVLNNFKLDFSNTLLNKTIYYNPHFKKILMLIVKAMHRLNHRCGFYKAKFLGMI